MHPITFYHPPLQMPLLKGAEPHFGMLLKDSTTGNKLHYELHCRLATSTETGHLQLHYHRHSLFINGAPPEGKIQKLAQELAAPFYPVVLEQAGADAPLELLNGEEIAARCRQAETQILQHYEGLVLQDCLRAFKIAYSNPNNILRVFQTDLFLQLLFGILPLAQRPGGTTALLSLLPQTPFHVLAGEPRTERETGSKYLPVLGTSPDGKSELSLSYCLYPTGSLVKSVTGSLKHLNEQGISEETTLELYHLNGEPVPQQYREVPAEVPLPAGQKEGSFLNMEVPEEKRGSGGWSVLF